MLTLASLRRTTTRLPTQFEGMTTDARPIYIRCKYGSLLARIGPVDGLQSEAVAGEPIVDLEFADRHRSDIDWVEVEALTGIRLAAPIGGPFLTDATRDDVSEIAILMRRVRIATMPYLPVLHDAAADLAFVERMIAESTVHVARQDRLLGLCASRPGWIDQLYVDPVAHGRGIGSRLLGTAMRGQSEVNLWCFERNEAARTFYSRRGFVEIERTDGVRNEEGEPDIRFRWSAGLA